MPKGKFGERVVDLRKAAGFRSTSKLAKKIQISQPSMRAIENGDTDPDEIKTQTFMALVNALFTNANYLYYGTPPMGPLISPNIEEAEAASLYRQLLDGYRQAWMAAGHAFREAQPLGPPSTDSPFEKAKGAR